MRLKEIRISRNMTQQQLAEMIGSTAARVSEWESGKSGISTKNLYQLSSSLNCRIDEILAD